MITLLMSLLLAATPARAQSTATLRGVDVYRSAVLTPDKARELFGSRLAQIVNLRNQRRPASTEKAEGIRRGIELEAAKLGGIAEARLAVTEYFTSVDHAMYATFDIVDEGDRGRLAFSPEPKKTVADPGGLLAGWKSYYDLGSELTKRGQMPVDRPDCPGFYCLWGGLTPELEALQQKFIAGAAAKERELRTVMAHEASPEKRAAALFVLSYGVRGEKILESCLAALKDPAPLVRGAGLQVLADIINHHKNLKVEAARVLPLLDDPDSSVRRKTLGLLVPLADAPDQRVLMLASAPRLVALLKLTEPGSHDLAFTVLSQLAQKSFGRREYVKWDQWAAESARDLK